MLAGRMKFDDLLAKFNNMDFFIETKYDGERIQCHYHNGEVKFFSRNSLDCTKVYYSALGEIDKKSINARSAILDGEIVVWDQMHKTYASFGENKKIAKFTRDNNISKEMISKLSGNKNLCCNPS